MGRGFFVIDLDVSGGSAPRRYVGHTGTQMGFRSFIYFDPERARGALIALNTRATVNYRGIYSDTRRDVFNNLFTLPRQEKSAPRPKPLR